MAGCKSLESLSLTGTFGGDAAWGEVTPISLEPVHQRRPCLKSLQMRQIPFLEDFVVRLLDPDTTPVNAWNLQTVLVQGEPVGDHAGIVQLLDASHRTLRHLTLLQGDECEWCIHVVN